MERWKEMVEARNDDLKKDEQLQGKTVLQRVFAMPG